MLLCYLGLGGNQRVNLAGANGYKKAPPHISRQKEPHYKSHPQILKPWRHESESMRNSSSSPSSGGTSKKSHLTKFEGQSTHPASTTPEKSPPRTRQRGGVVEIRKVAKDLQDGMQRNETTSSQVKTVWRQMVLPSPSKPNTVVHEPFKLSKKFELLGEFFDSLDSSIRLSRLKGSMASFTNVSAQIERLTDRRFTHGHLAQLKYVLPEAIVLKKVLVFDERTSCMKPDLHISINPEAVESDTKLLTQHGSMPLRKLFRTRLRDFCESHPECDEIPEETLPEPFSCLKKDHPVDTCAALPPTNLSSSMLNNSISYNAESANINENLSLSVRTSIASGNQHVPVASHMSRSFRRRFSQKSKDNGAGNTQQKFPLDSLQPIACPASETSLKRNPPVEGTEPHRKTYPAKLASEAAAGSERCPAICVASESSNSSTVSPSKTIKHTENKEGSLKSMVDMSTPSKPVSISSSLMTTTPALFTPKRHYMTPDDNTSSSLNKLVRRPPRSSSRSLKFDTPVKNKEVENEDNAGGLPMIDDDIFEILPENLIQSVREKERIAMEEKDPAISQAKRRKKIIASLPKLFNMIHFLCHKRSVITKEELISRIISNHLDIVDRSEVEEQLKLLLELVPDWISEKLASCGDYLFCINKNLNPETIRAALEEAK
ncbi:hypothetical protein RJT34_14661 [Clitoria ternatea]|uniref:CDT1 Geminin-binding domain-containing protein n=1 Tax=Clitoria ternatea TaxID=43366 RepID=A0AAN9JR61_CLITE